MIFDDKILYEEVQELASSNEIISKQSKTQTLNVLKSKLEELISMTDNISLKQKMYTALAIIEDCYKIDMYKFQFKGLASILQKDIKNFEETILLENDN